MGAASHGAWGTLSGAGRPVSGLEALGRRHRLPGSRKAEILLFSWEQGARAGRSVALTSQEDWGMSLECGK